MAENVLQIDVIAVDNATANMEAIAKKVVSTAGHVENFQGKLQRRFTFIAGQVLEDSLRGLGISIPGTGRLLDVFGDRLLKLGAAFPGLSLGAAAAVGGFAALSKVMKDSAEDAQKMNAALIESLGSIKKLDDINRDFADRTAARSKDRLRQIEEEIKGLERQRLQALIAHEALMGQARLTSQIGSRKTAETDLTAIEQNIAAHEKERQSIMATLDSYKQIGAEGSESIKERARLQREMQEILRETDNEILENFAGTQEAARAAAENSYKGQLQALEKARAKGIDVTKQAANIELLILAKTHENERKMILEQEKFKEKVMTLSLAALGIAMGNFLATGARDWKTFARDITIAVIDAVTQMVMSFMLALAVQAWLLGATTASLIGLAKAVAVIAGLQVLKIGVQSMFATDSPATLQASPLSDVGIGPVSAGSIDATGSRGSEAGGLGGRSVSSGFSQITNNVSIVPTFSFLDPSQISESRMKEIADMIGKYLTEGISTGQYGLR